MDLKWKAVDATPTLLGRLVLLSTIQDRETGVYRPWLIGIPDTGAGMETLHQAILMEWLGAGMKAQVADAAEYFKKRAGAGRGKPPLFEGGYAHLLPPNTTSVHREHFLRTIPKIVAMALAR